MRLSTLLQTRTRTVQSGRHHDDREEADPGRVQFNEDVMKLPLAPLVYPLTLKNKKLTIRKTRTYGQCERFMSASDRQSFVEQGSCYRKVIFIGDSAKCGSTFLYETLTHHPLFIRAREKELCAFRDYGKKDNWTGYWSEFGPRPADCGLNPAKPFAFDGCPNDNGWSYPEWKSCVYKDAFLILLVRDPIEKVVSGFHYWRNYEPTLTIDGYFANKTFLARASDYMAILSAHLELANYMAILSAHLEYWPADRIAIVNSVGITRTTCQAAMRNMTDFLGIPPIPNACAKSPTFLNTGRYMQGHYVPSLKTQRDFWQKVQPGMEAFFRLTGFRYDFGEFLVNQSEFQTPNHLTSPLDPDANVKPVQETRRRFLDQRNQDPDATS
eukprot:g10758.t1